MGYFYEGQMSKDKTTPFFTWNKKPAFLMQQAVIFLHIVVYFCTTFILHKGNYISKSYKNIGIKVKKKQYQWYLKAKPTALIIFLSRFFLVLSSF